MNNMSKLEMFSYHIAVLSTIEAWVCFTKGKGLAFKPQLPTHVPPLILACPLVFSVIHHL